MASLKLTTGKVFNPTEKNHVFAVVSQRFCLDPVLAGAEAIKLADRSVADHMRLLKDYSDNRAIFYTHSPSEPILALAAADIMYNMGKPHTAKILNTLSHALCGAGLVEKGHLGELCARIILLIARDYAAPVQSDRPNLLVPVRLLDVLNGLFGTTTWGGSKQQAFNDAFATAYVNFTHWATTRDPLPTAPTR